MRLLRLAAALAALPVCLALGVLVARLYGVPAGVLGALVLVLCAVLASEGLARKRLLAWLRSDAQGAPPPAGPAALVLGDMAYEMRRVLRRRDRLVAQERQRSTQFLTAVQASPIGVMLLDAEHRIGWCSRVAADHLGLEPRRDIGQAVTNLVRAPAFVEHMANAAAQQPVMLGHAGRRLACLLVRPESLLSSAQALQALRAALAFSGQGA